MLTRIKQVDTIISCDSRDSLYRHKDLWLQDGTIVHIGPWDKTAHREIDGSAYWLYPGFVNTHHHLYQYFTRCLKKTQGLELFPWLTTLYEIWKHINGDTVYLSSLAGMGELLKYGCTCCFDHHYVFPKNGGKLIERQMEAASLLGIRFFASRGSMDLSKKDGGLPPDSVVQSVDAILKDSMELLERYHGKSPMYDVALAPCSPFSVSPVLMKESAKLARAYGARLHTHVGETLDEENYTLSRFGMRPLAYMESLGWLGEDVWYAHGIHFNQEELRLLAQTGTGIAHCPNSNMKLHSGVCKVPELLSLKAGLGLAVDGSASNDGSNMMDEIRSCYLLHRLVSGSKAPSAYTCLRLATVGSAALLGRQKDLGCIAPGYRADFFMLKKNRSELLSVEDPADLFGAVGYHRPCDMVFVNGVLRVKEGELVDIDEEKLVQESQKEIRRLLYS